MSVNIHSCGSRTRDDRGVANPLNPGIGGPWIPGSLDPLELLQFRIEYQ